MTAIRGIYEEIMADLSSKGFGGYVQQLESYDHKNVGDIPPKDTPKKDIPTSIPQNVKTQNERPAGLFLLTGWPSSPICEVR